MHRDCLGCPGFPHRGITLLPSAPLALSVTLGACRRAQERLVQEAVTAAPLPLVGRAGLKSTPLAWAAEAAERWFAQRGSPRPFAPVLGREEGRASAGPPGERGASVSRTEKLFLPPTKMPPCDFVPEKYDSYSYEQMLKIRQKNVFPSLYTYYKKPLLIHQGHMQWLFDFEGRRYLDFFAGIVTVSVGHCHPKVTAAAQKQFGRLGHTSNIYLHPGIQEYTEKLTSLLPGSLKVAYLTNSGTEANDLAVLIARVFTCNTDVICLRGGYHGGSTYAMGITAIGRYKFGVGNGANCHSTMLPDVFRGLWGGSHCRDSPVQTIRKCSCSSETCHAKDQYIEQFKDTLQTCVPNKVAAFIAEPIQGVNGAVQFPKGFLKEVYQLVRERGGLCIADEGTMSFQT
ncbi:hypothetical protein E2320_017730 [Naja naja]|nr:hypothetical protein E2320_017730 [Naja naja]